MKPEVFVSQPIPEVALVTGKSAAAVWRSAAIDAIQPEA